MSKYNEYLKEILERKGQELSPKPIDDAALLSEIIAQIKDTSNEHREDSLNFFIYNVLPWSSSFLTQFFKSIPIPPVTPTVVKKIGEMPLVPAMIGAILMKGT